VATAAAASDSATTTASDETSPDPKPDHSVKADQPPAEPARKEASEAAKQVEGVKSTPGTSRTTEPSGQASQPLAHDRHAKAPAPATPKVQQQAAPPDTHAAKASESAGNSGS
jgi:hypothetical protein